MFSRSAEPAAGAARGRALLGGRSIAAHIAGLYTLSAVVLLASVVGLLYWVESQSLQWDDVHFLADKVQQLRLAMGQDSGESGFLAREVEVEGGIYTEGQHYVFYSRILDETGRVRIETPGAEKILPAELFPPPAADGELPDEARRFQGADGRSYILMSAWGATGGTPSARRMIQVALDDTDEKDAISHYQRASLVLVILGILFSAGIAVLIVRSGLRPLREIARVAEQITASRLNTRLQAEQWPLELAAFARAFDGMLGRLDDSHTRLSQFAKEMAHELRTPIQVLMGQTEFALSKEREPHEYRRILEPTLEEFQTLTRMIDGLLFLAHAENPKTQIERKELDVRRELEAVREFHEALAEELGVTVTCRGQARLRADPLLLRRAVTNLLSNALRHTPSGGQVVLSVDPADADGVVLKVSDTGCGIGPKDLPRDCGASSCPSRGTARCAGGPGLGLAIVKSIAALHGGTVALESRPGRGTTAFMHFPARSLADA
jgi:two-component system heavy metal sensor histidine kinase CusS